MLKRLARSARMRALGICFVSASAAADSSNKLSFGSVQSAPILWETPADVELTSEALHFTRAGTQARSQPLPLEPQHYYRIHTKMARGPGSTIHFAISYLDANNNPIEWIPNWQLKRATHANWLPLSPHPQHYIQGFVLPLGATQPRLQLRLDKADPLLESHSRWDLTELSIQEVSAVASCKELSADRQLGGDFEAASHDGLPGFWVQWSLSEHNHVELIDTKTPCKHVLRVKPDTTALVASSYLVPVTPGAVYQISVRARGHGRIELDAHSLSRDRPAPQRVGNATRGRAAFEIASDTWTRLHQLWFAEAPNIASAQVMVAVDAHSAVEIDAVELRACEALSSP